MSIYLFDLCVCYISYDSFRVLHHFVQVPTRTSRMKSTSVIDRTEISVNLCHCSCAGYKYSLFRKISMKDS
jgi:hypothetical protein